MLFLIANTAVPEIPSEGEMSEFEKEFWFRFKLSVVLCVVGVVILIAFCFFEGRKMSSSQPAEGQSSTITSNENTGS